VKKYINGKYIELTAEEITAMQEEQAKFEAIEKHRPLTELEVSRMLITAQINTIPVDDQTALRMLAYYPEWETEQAYAVGYKVQYKGKLYKVITAHTSQADWTPDAAVTLFERIDEIHDGTKYDPIPYDGNMTLVNGLYYTQGGVTYLCNRDTVNPVYNALSELVGLYVEVVA
jgi:hypothetical protein